MLHRVQHLFLSTSVSAQSYSRNRGREMVKESVRGVKRGVEREKEIKVQESIASGEV